MLKLFDVWDLKLLFEDENIDVNDIAYFTDRRMAFNGEIKHSEATLSINSTQLWTLKYNLTPQKKLASTA